MEKFLSAKALKKSMTNLVNFVNQSGLPENSTK
jgi:hypothetical protein